MSPTLTVFTPTYNRGYTLHLCYESLKRQTCKDFVWLIIDDGSTDDTKQLVAQWIEEAIVPIRYVFQHNQGMHGAHNTAHEHIDTELNVCIDSDDYMGDDAVERIIAFWKAHGNKHYAGIVALNADPAGKIIGTRLPEHLHAAKFTELYAKYKVRGDKKIVYRTELTRASPPYPLFKGEKYGPLSYKFIMIDQYYPLLIMDEVIGYVEYREDGSSLNMINQYKRNPRGFSFFRKAAMKYAPTYRDKLRENIHYVSSNIMLKNRRFVAESPCKLTTILAIPFGMLLYAYIQTTRRKGMIR